MVSRAVQTDLTWPLSAPNPVAITKNTTTDTQSQTSRHTSKEASGCDDVGQKTPSPPRRTAKSLLHDLISQKAGTSLARIRKNAKHQNLTAPLAT